MVILDSNVWISFLDKDDSNHKKANQIFAAIRSIVFVPEYIILEVATVISKRIGKAMADSFLRDISQNDKLRILFSSESFLNTILSFYLEQKDKNLSFVDYSLLYLSQKLKVITFDKRLQKALKSFSAL